MESGLQKLSGKPNILIIYPDQMRADAMSCAGNPCLKTPHIDRLAREGVRFENAYTAFPLCAPFRASFFTGKYPHSNGMYANHYPIPLNQDFLAQLFRDHGYRTGYIGKWHLDGGLKHSPVPPGERRLGFEHFVGFNRGHNYFGSIYYRDTDQPYTSKRYEPDYQTDHLLDFMDRCAAAPDGRPFLAMISYGPPHPPLEAPAHYLNLYSPDEVPISQTVPNDAGSRAEAGKFLAKYYGLIANLDHNVGRILDWLDRRELAGETVVIFVSDHGEMAGEHGCYAKKTFYRSAMQVPLLVRYPARFPAGRVVRSLVDPSIDTMPTLLDLCSLPTPAEVQGVSYLSLLKGSQAPTRSEIYYEILMEKAGPERFPVPERGVRTLEWLYVRTKESPKVLFDLKSDPLELNNLVHSETHRAVMQRLDQLLAEHMARTGDDWEIEALFPPADFQTHEEGARYAQELLKRAIVEP